MPAIPTLTLFRQDGACSIAAHMLLRELGIPFTDQLMIKSPDGAGLTPADPRISRADFLALNPIGYVPTLVVDDRTVITELPAVLSYIADLVPTRGLVGREAVERAKVWEFLLFLSVTVHENGFTARWLPARLLGPDAATAAVEAVQAGGLRAIVKGFEWVERRIRGERYAFGEQLTVVDLMLHTFWRWAIMSQIDMQPYPKFRKVVEEVEKLPSVRETLAAEQVPLQFGTGK